MSGDCINIKGPSISSSCFHVKNLELLTRERLRRVPLRERLERGIVSDVLEKKALVVMRSEKTVDDILETVDGILGMEMALTSKPTPSKPIKNKTKIRVSLSDNEISQMTFRQIKEYIFQKRISR